MIPRLPDDFRRFVLKFYNYGDEFVAQASRVFKTPHRDLGRRDADSAIEIDTTRISVQELNDELELQGFMLVNGIESPCNRGRYLRLLFVRDAPSKPWFYEDAVHVLQLITFRRTWDAAVRITQDGLSRTMRVHCEDPQPS